MKILLMVMQNHLNPFIIYFYYFRNITLMDLLIDLFIILIEEEQLILSGAQLLRRSTKTAVYIIGGDGALRFVISISPGVNESQIYLGRGYNYKTSLDWDKGTILNSYIDKIEMQRLAKNIVLILYWMKTVLIRYLRMKQK